MLKHILNYVNSCHLIGTCGNLWIFLRRFLGMRSRLITMNRKFTYSFVVFLKISQTFHNLGVHLSSSSTAWQYRNVAKLQETEKSIEHVIYSNLQLKVVSVKRCCGHCLHLHLVFGKLRIVEIHYLTNPVCLRPSQE